MLHLVSLGSQHLGQQCATYRHVLLRVGVEPRHRVRERDDWLGVLGRRGGGFGLCVLIGACIVVRGRSEFGLGGSRPAVVRRGKWQTAAMMSERGWRRKTVN